MEPLPQPGRVIGAGRGALILAMAGAGWIGWGLGVAQAYNAASAPLFGVATVFLWAWSIQIMRSGRALRRQLPASALPDLRFPTKAFAVIVVVEVLAIVAVIWLVAVQAHRPDIATDACALVIGLHYIPLAQIFGAPKLGVLGILIALWCIVSWSLFRSSTLVIAVTAGTGILMWATAIAVLLWARSAVRALT